LVLASERIGEVLKIFVNLLSLVRTEIVYELRSADIALAKTKPSRVKDAISTAAAVIMSSFGLHAELFEGTGLRPAARTYVARSSNAGAAAAARPTTLISSKVDTICVQGRAVAVRWWGPWGVTASRRSPRGSQCLIPLVERMGAGFGRLTGFPSRRSGAPRREARVGLPFAHGCICRRDGACSWAAWKMDWRDSLFNAFLQSRADDLGVH
jgi:hypothetical protein